MRRSGRGLVRARRVVSIAVPDHFEANFPAAGRMKTTSCEPSKKSCVHRGWMERASDATPETYGCGKSSVNVMDNVGILHDGGTTTTRGDRGKKRDRRHGCDAELSVARISAVFGYSATTSYPLSYPSSYPRSRSHRSSIALRISSPPPRSASLPLFSSPAPFSSSSPTTHRPTLHTPRESSDNSSKT